ncbi:glycosyltransferase family protein [Oenococcus oeni]|uniref:glycosyltransferase n=2 Tax=Oenococcus oeni TaxID=1247 RepID=UPI0016475A6F|nr:glycosyltransferase [Oenococcus oeni]
MIKEITVFSYGDSNLLKTWSNVPYFFTKTFADDGVSVNRVNVEPNRLLAGLWNRVFLRLIHVIFKNSTYTFDRTPFFRFLTNRKMKIAVQKYPQTDVFISISFSFHPKKYTDKPVLMFCDWTYDYYFQYFQHRKPDFLETQEIRNQHQLQSTADGLLALFPDTCKYISDQGYCKNVFYLGNVINSETFNATNETVMEKFNSNDIVFIGADKYLPGLITLLQAVQILGTAFKGRVQIIGINKDKIPSSLLSDKTRVYGYLDKSSVSERNRYYDIVNKAKVFVNTNPRWSSFSASLESMYHMTPIITTHYRSFIETFGENIKFGYYSENDPTEVSILLRRILNLNLTEYKKMSLAAHDAVTSFTWPVYIDKLENKIQSIIDKGK